MSGPRLRPQPDEPWRTYGMTPWGPGAITSVVRIVDIVPDHVLRREAVRYRYEYPVEMDRIETLSLDRFVDSHAAPYEEEEDWMRRRGAGPASWDNAPGRAVAALKADDTDYSFRCECGFSTRDTKYEAHVCPESADPVRPDEEPTP